MNSSTYERNTAASTTRRTRSRDADASRGDRLANYIVDVFFVALLAAPFLIFQSPASVQDAVVSSHAAIAKTDATAAAPATPAVAEDPSYGPQ
jgi:hypothetical protein